MNSCMSNRLLAEECSPYKRHKEFLSDRKRLFLVTDQGYGGGAPAQGDAGVLVLVAWATQVACH